MTLFAMAALAAWLLKGGLPPARLVPLATALVLGVCVGGVQLLPTLDVLRHSVRAVTTPEFRLIYSLPPINVIQLWSPYAFASIAPEYGLYNGAFCTVAISWLIVRWPVLKRNDLVLALMAFAVISLLLAPAASRRPAAVAVLVLDLSSDWRS